MNYVNGAILISVSLVETPCELGSQGGQEAVFVEANQAHGESFFANR
jgi:hypothetical protein